MTSQLSRRNFLTVAAAAAAPIVAGSSATPASAATEVEVPSGMSAEWMPALYEPYHRYPEDYGNFDRAQRPAAPDITHIVLNTNGGEWHSTISPAIIAGLKASHYSVRSTDGHVAQHVKLRDISWDAENKYFDMHSVTLMHEGYGMQASRWFTQSMYRASARLVRYLCRRHGIPADRGHILAKDQVVGYDWRSVHTGHNPGPGPGWDWERYFQYLGAPLASGTAVRPIRARDVVRILPGFRGNTQPMTGCEWRPDYVGGGAACETSNTNFVLLRVAPDPQAALITDPALGGSTDYDDIGPRATAGMDYVVAEVRGDWVGIYYAGQIAWFSCPAAKPTARVVVRDVPRTVTAKGEEAPVYGGAHPEREAYANPEEAYPVEPYEYRVHAGQHYVISDAKPVTDYYRTGFRTDNPARDYEHTIGRDRYLQINHGYRIGFVRADDVVVS